MKFLMTIIIVFSLFSCASNKVEEISPREKKANLYYGQGTAELLNKNYTVALKHLLDAHSLNPNDSKICNNLGMAYYYKKRPQIAIKFVKKALKIDPKNTDARINLASLYAHINQDKEAEKHYLLVLEDLTYQSQFKTYYSLAALYIKKNDYPKAITYLKQSINENDQYCPAHYKLGELFFKERRYNLALEKFKDASKGVCYDNPQPVYQQALALIELRDYGMAKLKLEEILERFALSEYERKARRKLKLLTRIQVQNPLNF